MKTPLSLALMSKAVNKYGFTPLAAHNGQVAVEIHKKHCHSIRVVLMDCKMPVMDGWAAAAEIARVQERTI